MIKKCFSSTAFLTCFFFGMLLFGCATKPSFQKPAARETRDHTVYQVLEKNIPETARRYVGIPYKLGADPDKTNGSDCSHLVSAVTRNSLSGSGFSLRPSYFTSESIKKNSFPVEKSDVRVGDIVFFKNEDGHSHSKHSGIVTRKQGSVIFFTQASTSKGVIETSTVSESWKKYWQHRLDSYRRWKKSVFVLS